MTSMVSRMSSAIGMMPSFSVNKNGVAKVIRKLRQSDSSSDITSVYKLVKRDLFDVCCDLERASNEKGLQQLADIFYLYEGGKAISKYVRVLQLFLHNATPTPVGGNQGSTQLVRSKMSARALQFEQDATETYILVLAVVCGLSRWCSDMSLYQQVIESGLLDTLLAEVNWIVARKEKHEGRLVLLVNILRLLYAAAKVPWMRAIMKNRTVPVLVGLHTSDVTLWPGGHNVSLCGNVRFLNSLTAAYLLVSGTGSGPSTNHGNSTEDLKVAEIDHKFIDLVFHCWSIVSEKPVDNNKRKAQEIYITTAREEASTEEELLRVFTEILSQAPDLLPWLTQKDFIPLLTSDILDRGSHQEKEQCLRFLLSLVKWEGIQFILALPRLARMLLTLVSSSEGILRNLAIALKTQLVDTIADETDIGTLPMHRRHLLFSGRDCRVCDVFETISTLMNQLTSRGCDELIHFLFGTLPLGIKKLLVSIQKCDENILLVAIRKNHVRALRLLLKDFGADANQQVLYTHFPSLIQQYVPLLWWAAADEKMPVMATLIAHGAKVNCSSSTGSTPLFAACARQRSLAVKYLLQNGADPNQTDRAGVTCLMKAVASPYVCQLLLERGAELNARDHRGKTALHVANNKGSQSLTKKLIECGADFLNLHDESGKNGLQEACALRRTQTVDFIMEKYGDRVPAEDQIQAYKLLTAYLLSGELDFPKAQHYWSMALKLQKAHGIRQTYRERCDPFPSMRHVCNVSDVALLSTRRVQPQEFALWLKECILGCGNMQVLTSVFDRGLSFLRMGLVDECLGYWIHVLKQKHKQHEGPLQEATFQPFECISCMASIADTIFDSCHGLVSRGLTSHVTFEQVLCILRTALEDGVHVASCSRVRPMNKSLVECIMKFSSAVITLLNCSLELQQDEAEIEALTACVRRLGNLNISTLKEQRLLHLVTGPSRSHGRVRIGNARVVKLLLMSGCNVNDLDADNSTALHDCITSWLVARDEENAEGAESARQMAAVLLEHGVHVDVVNRAGMRCSDELALMDIGYHPVRHVGLGCLAARAIKQHKLQYEGILPRTLSAFVALH